MPSSKPKLEKPEHATHPCLDELPYRTLVFDRLSPHGTPLYLVAGCAASSMKAKKALRAAYARHGGRCFYCKQTVAPDQLTIDHAEPVKLGGKGDLQNLLIACNPCNTEKSDKAIEAYKPDAGREWLSALLLQVQNRLNRLDGA